MSIDTCVLCESFVDTDIYPEAYTLGDFCICEGCQEHNLPDQPLKVVAKDDGVWLVATSPNRKTGLLNLNNIVNEMPKGVIRSAFVDAIVLISHQREM